MYTGHIGHFTEAAPSAGRVGQLVQCGESCYHVSRCMDTPTAPLDKVACAGAWTGSLTPPPLSAARGLRGDAGRCRVARSSRTRGAHLLVQPFAHSALHFVLPRGDGLVHARGRDEGGWVAHWVFSRPFFLRGDDKMAQAHHLVTAALAVTLALFAVIATAAIVESDPRVGVAAPSPPLSPFAALWANESW